MKIFTKFNTLLLGAALATAVFYVNDKIPTSSDNDKTQITTSQQASGFFKNIENDIKLNIFYKRNMLSEKMFSDEFFLKELMIRKAIIDNELPKDVKNKYNNSKGYVWGEFEIQNYLSMYRDKYEKEVELKVEQALNKNGKIKMTEIIPEENLPYAKYKNNEITIKNAYLEINEIGNKVMINKKLDIGQKIKSFNQIASESGVTISKHKF